MANPDPVDEDLSPEEQDQNLAHAVLGKFLGEDPSEAVDLLDDLEDPVVAAAVVIRVCQELDTNQIADLLDLLENEDDDQSAAGGR